MDDSSAKGVYMFNTTRKIGKWRTEAKPESEWGKLECPPIVSEDLWNQVNQIIEEQLKAWKRPGKPPVHLFSGLARCSCGHNMYVAANTPKYFCRKCRNKIPITDLENIVRNELKVFFGEPKRIAGHLKQANRNLAEKSALLDTHKREIQKVREEMHQTHQLYLSKQISGDGFRDLYAPAEERMKQLQAELPKLEAAVDLLKVNKLSAVEDKRKIVEALIEKIEIGNGEIDITFSHLPSSEDLCKNQQGFNPR
jgi:site-specific DNA recombinase